MKKVLFRSLLALLTIFLLPFQIVEACTGFIVGKNLTTDGSTLYGRTEDLEPNHNKVFLVHERKTNAAGEKLVDQVNGFEWTLPAESYKYTSVSDVTPADGIYDEVGFNEYGVSISATVSAKANKAIQKVDPYVEKGLAESILTTVVLPHVKTAREGVELMGKIVTEQGAAEGNIITIADKTGVWYMEILSGHQYVAIKFPDDKYAVFPNTFFLGSVDFADTENVIASEGVEEVAKKADSYKEIDGKFHISQSYNPPMAEADRSRAWAGITSLDPDAPISYNDAYFDLMHSTDKKISVADVMKMQRNRFEGTQFKPLDQMELDGKGIPQRGSVDPVYKYPLGNPNVMEAHVFQLKDNMPASMGGGTMWLAVGSPRFSPYLPYNGNITDTYGAYKVNTTSYSPDSWYWVASHIYDMAAKHQDLFGTSIQDKWKALEAKMIEEQAGLDLANAGLEDSSAQVTAESIARAEAVFKEMKALEAEMEAKIKEAETKPSDSSSSSSSSSAETSTSSSSSSTSSTSSSSSQSSTDQQVIDSLVDDATGISLKNADLVKAGLKLSVTKVNTDDQNADTYDIKLTDQQGQPVHQVSPTLVTMPIRKGATVEGVYDLKDGKPAEKFEFTVNENGTVHFTTSHFSSYQIQYKKLSPDVKKTSKFLPSTGEQVTFLGIIGVILLGVVIYVLKKSKKK
ncbi:C69 family dipeptidase [Streptococcus sinensis]|uniref:C69 family dipeptidase n=1 Tax=Streptococcus sinensis TaxID=176090 RepID=UPI001C2E686A|nr:C69 family dipeptidase [Streptococcus sinensis]MCD1276356.1 dipeptidase [Streptococcus sinensis]